MNNEMMSRSKEFLNNQTITELLRARSSEEPRRPIDYSRKRDIMNASNTKHEDKKLSKGPESSNDAKTNHSSKPQSKLQSGKKEQTRRRTPSIKIHNMVDKNSNKRMIDLKSVKEEPEINIRNIGKIDSPFEDGLETKQLESPDDVEHKSNISSLSGRPLKNNYLMNTNPVSGLKILEVKEAHG